MRINSMDTCKANVCVKNKKIIYNGECLYSLWNDFKKCPNKVYQDGFCKKCYEPDRRYKNKNWIPDQRWKRDGIYGEPYDFPYHISKGEKEWVKMIYSFHPHIKPQKKETTEEEIKETAEEKIEKIIIWLDNNSEKINYKLGSELKEMLS